jgi:uncharacterized protein YbjQ (UPF0145 family)
LRLFVTLLTKPVFAPYYESEKAGEATMLVVTTESVPGYRVIAVLGEVLGLTIRSRNPFREGLAKLSGGANPDALDLLARWRRETVAELILAAERRGANGILGMRWDHREVTLSVVELCAYGTAVVLVPDPVVTAGLVRPVPGQATPAP